MKIFKTIALLTCTLFLFDFAKAQYVRTYTTTGINKLQFNCITKAENGNFFIAGTADSGIYVAEVNTAGIIQRESVINVHSINHNLTSMITDANNNIVIVGDIKLNVIGTTSYVLKLDATLNLLFYRIYNNTLGRRSVISFRDIKDNPANGSYYLCGATRTNFNIGSDGLLMRIDRNTGAVTSYYTGDLAEDEYDAFVFDITQPGQNPGVLTTGRFSTSGGIVTFRPHINRHDNNFNFLNGNRYQISLHTDARIYSRSFVQDLANLAYAWNGDVNGTGFGIHTGLSVINGTTLSPVWQKQYVFTPASSTGILMNKVLPDNTGYLGQGMWPTITTNDGAMAGEMFFLRTDKQGNPQWSIKLANVLINERSHNTGFLLDGGYIYAVGFKYNAVTTKYTGCLVQVSQTTGAMNIDCAPVQQVVAENFSFSEPSSFTRVAPSWSERQRNVRVKKVSTTSILSCNVSGATNKNESAAVIENSSLIQLSPNPTTGNALLTLLNNKESVNIKVADISGKLLWQSITANNSITIPSQKFASGLYIVRIETGKGVKTLKLVKE